MSLTGYMFSGYGHHDMYVICSTGIIRKNGGNIRDFKNQYMEIFKSFYCVFIAKKFKELIENGIDWLSTCMSNKLRLKILLFAMGNKIRPEMAVHRISWASWNQSLLVKCYFLETSAIVS